MRWTMGNVFSSSPLDLSAVDSADKFSLGAAVEEGEVYLTAGSYKMR